MLGIIINPKSGKKFFRKQRLYLWRELKSRHEPFVYRVTRYAGHAIELGRELVELGYDEILILGGDGTLNEVINGIMTAQITDSQRKKIRFGIMPRGTGNDWGRFWNIGKDYKQATSIFFNGVTVGVDVGCITFYRNGIENKRYFINSVGSGVDAQTCENAMVLKHYLGSHRVNYYLGLLVAFLRRRRVKVKLCADGQFVAEGVLLTMSIGNGPFSGGGIKQVPQANPVDGVLHGIFISSITLKNVLQGLWYLLRHRLADLPFVTSFYGQLMEITTHDHIKVEVDGILLDFMGSWKVECLPQALKMIAAKNA